MNRIVAGVWFALGLLAQTATAQTPPPPVMCNGDYALCTSAPCIPDPAAPGKRAICQCEVHEGENFGLVSTCEEREPVRVPIDASIAATEDPDAEGEVGQVIQIRSTFSFAQAPQKPVMKCAVGNPWTDCLDVKCTVDPADPLRAICSCKMGHDEYPDSDFVTFGGACNPLSCKRSFWSAATPGAMEYGSAAMMGALGLQESPVTFCPLLNHPTAEIGD